VNAPPIIGKYVEDGQQYNQEGCGPLGLETNSDHDAGGEAEQRHEDTTDAPRTLEDKANEEEDQEDTASKLEVFPPVILSHARNAGKKLLSRTQSVTKDHEQATDDGKVAEEEVEVEDETIAKALNDDDGEKAAHSILGVALSDDRG